MIVKPLLQPRIKPFAPDNAFHRPQEIGAFVIDDRTADGIEIDVLMQRCAWGIHAHFCQGFFNIGEG
ncbi:MAG: hypothetical protein NWP41_07005, partial [Ilumatobacteraceae bacterium]|nr:hypothetical protein [Ilumatobacteraceae bacterium]